MTALALARHRLKSLPITVINPQEVVQACEHASRLSANARDVRLRVPDTAQEGSRLTDDQPIRFGRFEIRPRERQLLADGRQANLGARAFRHEPAS